MKKEKSETTVVPAADERAGLASASGMERRVFCAGSGTAEKAFPRDDAGEIAQRGEDIHRALQTGDDSGLELDDKAVTRRLSAIEEEAIAVWAEEFGIDKADIVIVREERFWLRDRATLKAWASAQVDCAAIAVNHQRALVIDAKSGFLETTPAEINWQLKTQAVAIWHEYPMLTHIRTAISSARTVSKFDPCDYTIGDLPFAEQQLWFYVKNSEDPFAPRVPGPWCRYCRAKGDCREAASFAMVPSVVASVPLALTTLAKAKEEIALRVAAMSPADLKLIHSRKAVAVGIFDAVSDRLKLLPKDELAALGLELVPNAPMRGVPDVQKAYAILAGDDLITAEEFRSVCKLPVGALEELIVPRIHAKVNAARKGTAEPPLTIEEAKRLFNDQLSPVLEFTPKAGSLKPLKKKETK